MKLILGIDTGGTYTDAVLLNEESRSVIAKAKALTTHQALDKGISQAVTNVITKQDVRDIGLVSVSTTLATNAVVEGVRQKICAVLIGFEKTGTMSADLQTALLQEDVVYLSGGHNGNGEEKEPLDLIALEDYLKANPTVSGFAVTAYFSVRNPEHELATKALINHYCDLPVTCSHELAEALGAPMRSLTAILNARLIGLSSQFVKAIEAALSGFGINAPLMVVKGDGSLVNAREAKAKPIETVFSGPAASLVGASYLTEVKDAIISDIGGTTTDIAVLKKGQPKLNPEGLRIGGWRTMVRAVDMHTFGLGGDSEVGFENYSSRGLSLGPRRLVPVSLFACEHETLVVDTLERQLADSLNNPYEGRFVMHLVKGEAETAIEATILERFDSPIALDELIQQRRELIAVNKLVAKKQLALVGFTPSDAAHVLGIHKSWNVDAAKQSATLFAKKKDLYSQPLASSPERLSQAVIDLLIARSADILLDTSFVEDGLEGKVSSQHPMIQAALNKHSFLATLSLSLTVPLIGLGASASTYYADVGKRLNTKVIVPEHAEVANAIGAVVGLVRAEVTLMVSQPKDGTYRVHLSNPLDFADLDEALSFAEETAIQHAKDKALQLGGQTPQLHLDKEEKRPKIGGEELFLEAQITATAFGRPSF